MEMAVKLNAYLTRINKTDPSDYDTSVISVTSLKDANEYVARLKMHNLDEVYFISGFSIGKEEQISPLPQVNDLILIKGTV